MTNKTKKERSYSKDKEENAKKSRKIRERLNEKQIDKMINDSFPASDPPSTY